MEMRSRARSSRLNHGYGIINDDDSARGSPAYRQCIRSCKPSSGNRNPRLIPDIRPCRRRILAHIGRLISRQRVDEAQPRPDTEKRALIPHDQAAGIMMGSSQPAAPVFQGRNGVHTADRR